jgi:hypothetical protein
MYNLMIQGPMVREMTSRDAGRLQPRKKNFSEKVAALMFAVLCIALADVESDSITLGPNLDPSQFAPNFETVVDVRLFGFTSAILQASISSLLQNYLMRVDVTKPEKKSQTNVHHSFSARSAFFDLPANFSRDIASHIREHVASHPTTFAVYVIQSHNSARKGSNVVARGNSWIAFRFYDSESGPTDQLTASRIISRVFNIFNDVFVHPVRSVPRISVLNNSASVVVFQPPPLNAFNSIQVVRRSVASLASLVARAEEFDTDYVSVICAVCENGPCAADWLRRLPEYTATVARDALPIFLLPQSCPHQYAANDIAFAPTNSQIALEAVTRKALFAWEPGATAEPFFEIMARRNMAIYPLQDLTETLTKPVDEIAELKAQFASGAVAPRLLQTLDELYGMFIAAQKKYMRGLLKGGVRQVEQHWKTLENITQLIVDRWSVVSENVQRKRVCVGNLKDLTAHPSIFFRPSFYCVISLVSSALMWRVILKLARPREIIELWNGPQPLL